MAYLKGKIKSGVRNYFFSLMEKKSMRCLNVFVCKLLFKRFEIDAVSPFSAVNVTNKTVLF